MPQGLTVQNAYTELRQSSKSAVVVIRNSMAYPQTLLKKILVTRAIAVATIPKLPTDFESQGEESGPQNPRKPKLTMRQRQGKFFNELDLSGLRSLSPELADAARHILAEYHDVFSLDPAEFGCTHSTEHTITLTDDTPFKERFRQTPPPLVEEVRRHLKEMLTAGTIRPSQSAWCNAVVLVRKKDGRVTVLYRSFGR